MKYHSKNVQTKIKDAVYALEMRQLLLSAPCRWGHFMRGMSSFLLKNSILMV